MEAIHFSVNKNEVEWMLALFDQLAGKGGNKKPGVFLERLDFLAFLFKQFGMTDDLMMERGKGFISVSKHLQ